MSRSIGENIRNARVRRGFSREGLARALKKHRSTIRNWEIGRTIPRDHELAAVTEVLACGDLNNTSILGGVEPSIAAIPVVGGAFENKVIELARSSERFVHYSRLNRVFTTKRYYRPRELTDQTFVDKLQSGAIIFQCVDVLLERQTILNSLMDSQRFDGKYYYHRYFPTPTLSIPIINMRSFDDRIFLIGGFEDRREETGRETALMFDGRNELGAFFREYWKVLWRQSKPFPDPDSWDSDDVLWRDLGLQKSDWKTMVRSARKAIPTSHEG